MLDPKRRRVSYIAKQKRRATLMAVAIAAGFVGAILYALSVGQPTRPPTRLVNNVVCVPLSKSEGILLGDDADVPMEVKRRRA